MITPGRKKKKRFEPTKQRSTWEHRKDWTPEEDEIVRKQYKKKRAPYLAELLGRTITSVQHRAQRLGVRGDGGQEWTSREILIMKRQYPKLSAAKIAEMLGRTLKSVRAQIHVLGLGGEVPERWKKADVEYLRKHYGKARVAELAEELGRSPDAVELKAGKLGLRKSITRVTPQDEKFIVRNLGKLDYTEMARTLGISVHNIRNVAARHGYYDRPTSRPWSQEDDAKLRQLWGTTPRKEIAASLNRTVVAIGVRAGMLGLTRGSLQLSESTPWSPEEDKILRSMFATSTRQQIADRLGRTRASVQGRAQKLGLAKYRRGTGEDLTEA